MTERTATINGVTLTETQLREGLAQLEQPPFKAGDKFCKTFDRGTVWTVLTDVDAKAWGVGRKLTEPFALAAVNQRGTVLQFYKSEFKDMGRVQ